MPIGMLTICFRKANSIHIKWSLITIEVNELAHNTRKNNTIIMKKLKKSIYLPIDIFIRTTC